MKKKQHIIVIDPIAFSGGSKVATKNILKQLNSELCQITILTKDHLSWSGPDVKTIILYEPCWLARYEQGWLYFFRHFILALNLLVARFFYGRFEVAIGASGPGVDLALYLVKPFLKFRIIQLVHGPVAQSRTIGRCLLYASQVYYLSFTKGSIIQALNTLTEGERELSGAKFLVMNNGLPAELWPTRCQTHAPVIFWAASLLGWKGLETLVAALKIIDAHQRPATHICYIKPRETTLPVSQAPIAIDSVSWYRSPNNLDQIRASANIFVSTSRREPFGLSVLEAMAAGHCIVIPADGAYWDGVLVDRVSCIKYTPDDANDLADALLSLSQNLQLVQDLGNAAAIIATRYKAENTYRHIKHSLEERQRVSRQSA